MFGLVIVLVCIIVFIYAILYAIDENKTVNEKITELARVIEKNIESKTEIHPITIYNGCYGYDTQYVETFQIKYLIKFKFELKEENITFSLSKKQYESLSVGDFGYLTYQIERFRSFEKL